MRYLMRFTMPNYSGNEVIKDPEFGKKMEELLKEVKAETCYFTAVNGQRGGYAVLNLNDASEIPLVAEPFFFWLKSDIEFYPVMKPEDLMKADEHIQKAIKKWSN